MDALALARLKVDGTPLEFREWKSSSMRFWSEQQPTSLRR